MSETVVVNEGITRRFDLLDGMRGVAAFAVMIYHYTYYKGLGWLPGAWVSVDLFFILSGLVIAHSYGSKILKGMTFWQFLLRRIIRLAPLYTFGLLLGFFAALYQLLLAPHTLVAEEHLIAEASLGFLWLPYLWDLIHSFVTHRLSGGPVFPLNEPSWSLFFEIFANVFFYFYVLKTKKPATVRFVFVALLIYIGVTLIFKNINPGWGESNFIFGFPRVIAEFFLGSLIYQLGFHLKRYPNWIAIFLFVLVAGCFFVRVQKIEFLNSIFFIPILIAVTSSIEVTGFWKKICGHLGELSYPLYIVHFPVFKVITEFCNLENYSSIQQVLMLATISIVLSLSLAKVDLRIRKNLNQISMPK